jgi:transposase InsO family protein
VQYDLTFWEEDKETGDKYIFLAVDHFTKFAFARAIADKSAGTLERTISALLDVIPRPKKVLSDNGSEFRNQLVVALLEHEGVAEMHGRPYHKTTNGGAERINLTISKMVRGVGSERARCTAR